MRPSVDVTGDLNLAQLNTIRLLAKRPYWAKLNLAPLLTVRAGSGGDR